MALKLPNGNYIRINTNESNFLNGKIAFYTYVDSGQRDIEKATGALPPFTINTGDIIQSPILSAIMETPLAGLKSAKDEILVSAYSALKTDKFPDAIDV